MVGMWPSQNESKGMLACNVEEYTKNRDAMKQIQYQSLTLVIDFAGLASFTTYMVSQIHYVRDQKKWYFLLVPIRA